MKWSLLINLLICYLITYQCLAQEMPSMGFSIDSTTISQIPKTISLSFRSFDNLPSKYSLEEYCPTPKSQGQLATCTSFANSYAIGSILYAQQQNIKDKSSINKFSFAPSYNYQLVKRQDDINCKFGSDIIKSFMMMKTHGNSFFNELDYTCNIDISSAMISRAKPYRIKDFNVLYVAKGYSSSDNYYLKPQQLVLAVKKALTEDSPVSSGFVIPPSFFYLKNAVWIPDSTEENKNWAHNAHAMAIVGYDDTVAGGSFRVMNSWGENWGDKGFVWIRYSDFSKYCIIAIQPYREEYYPSYTQITETKEKVNPLITTNYGGKINFIKLPNKELKALKKDFIINDSTSFLGYAIQDTLESNDEFKFYIQTYYTVYLYAISSDGKIPPQVIIPYESNQSTLIGKETIISFPSDNASIVLDQTIGKEVFYILLSSQPIDITSLTMALKENTSSVLDILTTGISAKFIKSNQVSSDERSINFKSSYLSNISSHVILPIAIEFVHQ